MRTAYSFKDAVGTTKECVSRIVEIGDKVAPIHDVLSTFGFVDWTKNCNEVGLRPVYGVTIRVTCELGLKNPGFDEWTFFCKDRLAPLHELIELATDPLHNGLLTYFEAFSATDLYRIAGPRCVIDCLPDAACTDTCFFVALSPATPRGLFREAKAKGLQFLAMSANKYPREEDNDFYQIVLGRKASQQTWPQHELSAKEWKAAVKHIGTSRDCATALKNREAVLAGSVATLQKATMLKPAHGKTLLEMCEDGARLKRVNLDDPVYKARLKKELDLIFEKKFEDYFYVIADVIAFAKDNMLVGPGRGSSSGSLVCYLLSITEIDSIKFDLLFDRFLSPDRMDMPDIDIDFSDQKREMVFKYIDEKYGKDHVGRLGTVSMFRPRSALKQVAAQLRIPKYRVNQVLEGLIERSSGDSRALDTMVDTLTETNVGKKFLEDFPHAIVVGRMEGMPNNSGQHAAGVVLTEGPIKEYVATDKRTGVSMCDKKASEYLNLLKIDALGLKQLGIFEGTMRRIGIPNNQYNQFMRDIPIDDQKAFDVLNNRHFAGIFQYTGKALQSLVKTIFVDRFDDVVLVTALARPGPIATGGAVAWTRRRMGKEKVSYPHPLLQPYLEETLGIITYQETVIIIGREIGDLSSPEVSKIRKAMSASLGIEAFNKIAGDKWKANAIKKGIPPDIAENFWNDLCKQGSWSFNKSHAVAYGMVSYHCMWLKAHYPLEFAAATLDAEDEPGKQIQMLRELKEEGIDYIAVDPQKSTHEWSIDRKRLVGPLTSIKGIGPAAMRTILEAREKRSNFLPEGILKKLEQSRTDIDSLTPIADRVAQLHPDLSKINIVSKPVPIKELHTGFRGSFVVIGRILNINPRNVNDAQNLTKRGGKRLSGPQMKLNMFVEDDSDEILTIIDRFKYDRLAPAVIERGRPKNALYAIKGTVPRDFRMISIEAIRFLGFMDE